MKGRVIIQGMGGFHYREDISYAVVEYENKLYKCGVFSEMDGSYMMGNFVRCYKIK